MPEPGWPPTEGFDVQSTGKSSLSRQLTPWGRELLRKTPIYSTPVTWPWGWRKPWVDSPLPGGYYTGDTSHDWPITGVGPDRGLRGRHIYINPAVGEREQVNRVLPHELGHAVQSQTWRPQTGQRFEQSVAEAYPRLEPNPDPITGGWGARWPGMQPPWEYTSPTEYYADLSRGNEYYPGNISSDLQPWFPQYFPSGRATPGEAMELAQSLGLRYLPADTPNLDPRYESPWADPAEQRWIPGETGHLWRQDWRALPGVASTAGGFR